MDNKEQIKKLPQKPGVYFFHDKDNRIIYIGKAASLKTRVTSHFSTPIFDLRAEDKVKNTAKITFIECNSEVEALFLEPEFIKRYHPKYNVEWKDEKNFLYVKVKKLPIPEIQLVRRPLKEPKTIFYGPYTDSKSLRKSLRFLARILPVKYSDKGAFKAAFLWHDEILKEIERDSNIFTKVQLFFGGKVKKLVTAFERDMEKASQVKQFEKAALFRDRIRVLEHIREIAIFRKEEGERLRSDIALIQLEKSLRLKNFSHLIEAYDISNIFGKEAVGSLVTFKNGLPDKNNYKRFKIKTVKGVDDYKMIQEVLKRRFQKTDNLPDLILIDGGKGQLSAALRVLESLQNKVDIISIAKKNEEIFIKLKNQFKKIILEKDSPELLLIERIRDEAHRFAIIYHRLLRSKKGRLSELDNISGVGEKTKKKLMKQFKTIGNIRKTSAGNLVKIVGAKLTEKISRKL